jgi:hypothetical protein
MKYLGTKHRTVYDDGRLKPRKRRKVVPDNFEDDDIEYGYDVLVQEGENASLAADEDMGPK